MRLAVLTDIHGNLPALEAVLAAVNARGIRRIWCLGDLIGYGADPEDCVRRIRDIAERVIAGNHEWALLGRTDVSRFNPLARYCIEWARSRVSGESRNWLAGLPLEEESEDCHLVHGSLAEPENFRYPRSHEDMQTMLAHSVRRFILFGHTHQPRAFVARDSQPGDFVAGDSGCLQDGQRIVLNPGSAGQPRDEDPRVGWLELDTSRACWRLHRVVYDVDRAVARLREEKLPEVLARCLCKGLDT